MSVTMRQPSRTTFGTEVAVLTPLYSDGSDAWQLSSDGETLCGCGDDCQMRLNMEGIEERHCSLTMKAGQLSVRRLGGRIWVNDLPISSVCGLAPGDTLCVGPISFQISTMARPESARAISGTTETPAVTPQAPPVVTTVTGEAVELLRNLTEVSRPVALMAEVSDARSSMLQERQKLLDLREQQIQEYSIILQDRERSLTERQRSLEERSEWLAEQKRAAERQVADAETLRATLQKQKDEIDRRVNLLSDRESMLNSQLESSAAAYAQLETTRADFALRLESISSREQAVEKLRKQCDEKSHALATREADIASATEALQSKAEALAAQEQILTATQDGLKDREAVLLTSQKDVAAREQELTALQESLTAREESLVRLSQELATREEAVRRESEANAARNEAEETDRLQRVEEFERALKIREQELAVKLEEIARARDEQDSAESCLAQQRTELAARAAQLDQTAAELAARTAALESQRVEAEAAIAKGSQKETRSVSQLAAIAAEREAAVRAREEAVNAQQAAAKARAELAEQEVRLQTWQTEIDARQEELANRVSVLKSLRNSIRSDRESAAAEFKAFAEKQVTDTAENVASAEAREEADRRLQEEWSRLEQRQAELTEAENRLAELQQASRIALQNAEAEREALQSAHKDLICERNSLMQFNQDLQSRSNGLSEREAIVVQQKEDLRNRFDALTQQSSDLQKHEAELNARAAELHRRVTELKSESRTAREKGNGADDLAVNSGVSVSDSEEAAAERKRLEQSLEESEAQRVALVTERESLLTAVRELQAAMNNARADVQEASRIRAEFARTEQTVAKLYQTIEERSAQLQVMESKLRQSEELTEALKKQISELPSLDSLHEMAAEKLAESKPDSDSDDEQTESALLHEIEAMRNELQSSVTSHRERNDEMEQALSVRDLTISELQGKITELQRQLENAAVAPAAEQSVDLIEVDQLRDKIERSEQVLRDRDDLIRELRARLLQQSQQAAAVPETIDQQRLQNEARELDHRANLLDAREEELREKMRQVSQSEGELEQQRRQLLDARQQLEIARAEIQVAMKQHNTAPVVHAAADPSNHSAGSNASIPAVNPFTQSFTPHARPAGDVFDSVVDAKEETDDDRPGATDLRSELANLFGLKKPVTEKPTESNLLVTDYLDLSEPAGDGKAVAFKFADDLSSLIQPSKPQETTPAVEGEPEREENSDDFVRDYMEQLLSRSRKAAGNSLPTELKPQKNAAAPAAANAQAGSPPKQKSFIDQYMAGGYGDLMENGSASATPPAGGEASASAAPTEPLIPRAKVDRQKLRENMDSFRSLSTQSVENALVDHAIRQERINIYGRVMFTFVLILMTAFLAIANMRGIIQSPSLIWVSLVCAIGAGAETVRKWYSVKGRGRLSLQGDVGRDAGPTGLVHPIIASHSAADTTAPLSQPLINETQAKRDPQGDSDSNLPHRDASNRFNMAESDEDDRSRYFEL